MSIAAVVLAAGASTRLGRPKQTVVFGGETLLERAVRIATDAGLAPVIVVVADVTLIGPLKSLGVDVLLNREAHKGMSTTIAAGVRWASGLGASGVILLTCDQVALTADHMRSLSAQPTHRAGSAYAGRIGIPAYFPASDFPTLLQLEGDTGARDLLRDAHSVTNEDLVLDIDTEADLARARQLLKG